MLKQAKSNLSQEIVVAKKQEKKSHLSEPSFNLETCGFWAHHASAAPPWFFLSQLEFKLLYTSTQALIPIKVKSREFGDRWIRRLA